MKVVAIIQARMGSTRLPGKVLADLGGRPMLAFMLARLEAATTLDATWVATTTDRRDDSIVELCASLRVPVFRGPEDDVLARYVLAAEASRADAVVRLTADCPLICPEVSDKVVRAFLSAAPEADYASNTLRRTYPRGLDTEIVGTGLLRSTAGEAAFGADREHVTRFIWRQPERFRLIGVEDVSDNSDLRWTVDQEADLEAARRAVAHFGPGADTVTYGELLGAFRAHPEWIALNRAVEQERA